VVETTKHLSIGDGLYEVVCVIPRSKRSLAGREDSALECGERTINACDDLFFSENLEQMIETWSDVTASHCQSSWMHDRADFYTEFGGRAFQCRFDFGDIEFFQNT